MPTIESTTTVIAPDVARAASMIGRPVRFQGTDHYVYSVEGSSWYVFSGPDNSILADQSMTELSWLETPRVMIIPFGRKIGEGVGVELDFTSNVFAHWH